MSLYQTIFINDHFVVVDKDPNVLSVPGRNGEDDPRPCLGRILEIDLNKRVYPVHRLDFEVQGLIMFALNPEAHKSANSWFNDKTIQKIYSAITKSSGKFKIDEDYVWESKLLRGKKRAYESPVGKASLTKARLCAIDGLGFSHWELEPVTGRSHQLRYELFKHFEPILGDALYGSTDIFNPGGIALRSYQIDFSKIKNRNQFNLPEIISSKKL